MTSLCFAYPGDLDMPTGGYGYDRQIIAGLRDIGWTVDLLPLGDGFPFPSAGTLRAAEKALVELPKDTPVVIDGLAFGAMGEAAERLGGHLRMIALVHHPLCLENGLGSEHAGSLKDSEKRALACVSHVIVTSPATASQVSDLFDVPGGKIGVVLPGTDLPEICRREHGGDLRLLSVGTIVPRKGYDILFQALATLKEHAWHLDIVGGLDADPTCYRSLRELAGSLGISARLTFHGAVAPDDLAHFYRQAGIFVLASRYEGYGMAYTEALAYGLPVIGSGGGAVRQTLPEKAAIYCPPDDIASIRAALELLLSDPARRDKLGNAARRSAEALPHWQDAARQFSKVLKDIGT